jgi:hypothetical protein
MKKSIPLIILLSVFLLVASGINNQANSSMGVIKSCMHNQEEYIRIGVTQSCENFHELDHTIEPNNPDDCLLQEFIIQDGSYN